MNSLRASLAVGGALALSLMVAVPAFAQGKEPSPALTIDYVSAPTLETSGPNAGNYQYTVKVSGLEASSSGKQYYVGFRYGNLPKNGNNGDDSGTQVSEAPDVTSTTGSQVFTIEIPQTQIKKGYYLDATEYSSKPGSKGENDGGGKEIRQESAFVSMGNLPYGQLPQVPWAVGLPAIGLGLGAAVWLRQRRRV